MSDTPAPAARAIFIICLSCREFLSISGETTTLMMRMSKTLPGLDNFHMAGQWVEPGGSLLVTAMSGRNVRQVICKQDKKEFVASTP